MKNYTMTEIKQKPELLYMDLPIRITKRGRIICEVDKPGRHLFNCEKCEDPTKNQIKFKSKTTKKWEKLSLCDECQETEL